MYNQYVNGEPAPKSIYDHFTFNLGRWVWTDFKPKGCMEQILEVMLSTFDRAAIAKKYKELALEQDYLRSKQSIIDRDKTEHFEEFLMFNSKVFISHYPEKNLIRVIAPSRFSKDGIASRKIMCYNYDMTNNRWTDTKGHPFDTYHPQGCEKQLLLKIQEFYQKIL